MALNTINQTYSVNINMFHTEYTQRRLVIQIYLFGLKFDDKASLLLYRTYPEKNISTIWKIPSCGPGVSIVQKPVDNKAIGFNI